MKSPSPLFVWKLLLIIIAIAGAFLFYSDPMKVIAQKRNDSISHQLSAVHFSENETGIIFFGNSLMDSALPLREEDMDRAIVRELEKQSRTNISVRTFNAAMGGFGGMELKAMGDQLMSTDPDFVVIQSEIIVVRHNRNPESMQKDVDRIGMWSGLIERQLMGKLPKSTQDQSRKSKLVGRELMEQQTADDKEQLEQERKEENLTEAKGMWQGVTVSNTTPEFQASRQFIQHAVSKGIRVIVLELPVSRTAVNFATDEYFKQRTAAIRSLIPEDGLTVLRYPRVLPDDYFKDFSHLRPRGRKEFLSWFVPALTQELTSPLRHREHGE